LVAHGLGDDPKAIAITFFQLMLDAKLPVTDDGSPIFIAINTIVDEDDAPAAQPRIEKVKDLVRWVRQIDVEITEYFSLSRCVALPAFLN
jgi:hypothetical protein